MLILHRNKAGLLLSLLRPFAIELIHFCAIQRALISKNSHVQSKLSLNYYYATNKKYNILKPYDFVTQFFWSNVTKNVNQLSFI